MRARLQRLSLQEKVEVAAHHRAGCQRDLVRGTLALPPGIHAIPETPCDPASAVADNRGRHGIQHGNGSFSRNLDASKVGALLEEFAVFRHHGVAFFPELPGKNLLQCRKTNAHHIEASANCERVLGHLVTCDVSQLGDGKRAELYALRRGRPA